MTPKLYLLLLALFLFCGCNEKVSKANPIKLTVDRYLYQFEADKLVYETETISHYSNGVIQERSKIESQYIYDSNERLVKKISKMSMDSLSETYYDISSID